MTSDIKFVKKYLFIISKIFRINIRKMTSFLHLIYNLIDMKHENNFVFNFLKGKFSYF